MKALYLWANVQTSFFVDCFGTIQSETLVGKGSLNPRTIIVKKTSSILERDSKLSPFIFPNNAVPTSVLASDTSQRKLRLNPGRIIDLPRKFLSLAEISPIALKRFR